MDPPDREHVALVLTELLRAPTWLAARELALQEPWLLEEVGIRSMASLPDAIRPDLREAFTQPTAFCATVLDHARQFGSDVFAELDRLEARLREAARLSIREQHAVLRTSPELVSDHTFEVASYLHFRSSVNQDDEVRTSVRALLATMRARRHATALAQAAPDPTLSGPEDVERYEYALTQLPNDDYDLLVLDLMLKLGAALLESKEGEKTHAVDRAVEVYRHARELCLKGGDPANAIVASTGLANALSVDPQRRRERADEALALYEALNRDEDGAAKPLRAQLRAGLARILFDRPWGNRQLHQMRALVLQTEAVELLEDCPSERALLARALHNLGSYHLAATYDLRSQHVDEAVRALERARDLRPPDTHPSQRARTLRMLALAYPDWSRADSLAHAHALAEAARRESAALVPTPQRVQWELRSSALDHPSLEDLAPDVLRSMVAEHEEALTEISLHDTPLLWVKWMGGLGRLRWALSVTDASEVAASFAAFELAIERAPADPHVRRSLLRGLAALAHGQLDWVRSREAHAGALAESASLLREAATLEERLAVLEEDRGLALIGAYAAARSGEVARAVELAELGRARSWLDDFRVVEVLQCSSAAPFHDAAREAQRRVTELEQRLVEAGRNAPSQVMARGLRMFRGLKANARLTKFSASDEQAFRKLRVELSSELVRAREALREVLERARVAAPELPPESFGLDDVRRAVTESGRPLVYLFGTTMGTVALGAFVDGSIDALELDFTSDRSKELLDDAESSGTRLASAVEQLTASLMSPLRTWLGARGARVSLVPFGMFGQLPLHVAAVEAGLTASFVPSARVLLAASRSKTLATARSRVHVVVGDPQSRGARPLAFASLEAANVSSIVGGVVQELGGATATREGVLAALAQCTHFHYAGHATFLPWAPMESSLHLHGDDRLLTRDIAWLPRAAGALALVVLSACESGNTESDRAPEEVLGFPVAYLASGAASVVATTWKVDDVVAALLIDRLYRGMFEDHRDVADALVESERWLRTATATSIADAATAMQGRVPEAKREVRQLLAAFLRDARRLPPEATPFSAPEHWGAFVHVGV